MTEKRQIIRICGICGTEHGVHQAHQFAREAQPVVVNKKVVVNKPSMLVANRSADRHVDKARRREYMRDYMAARRKR